MGLIKNTDFVIGGTTYVMNQNFIIMGSDVLFLCSEKTAHISADLKIGKFVVDGGDETNSSIELLPGISISWDSVFGADDFTDGQWIHKKSDTEAYVVVCSSQTAGNESTSLNKIVKITKSGSTYSSSLIRDNIPLTKIPWINKTIVFALNGDILYYTGYGYVASNKMYAYDIINDTIDSVTFPSEFDSSWTIGAVIWKDHLWACNSYAELLGYPIDANGFVAGADFKTYTSNRALSQTPVLNILNVFGDDSLWVSRGYDPYYSGEQIDPYVIEYESGAFTRYDYSIESDFVAFVDMSVLGGIIHQRHEGCIPLSSELSYVISSNHGNDPDYSAYLYKIEKNSEDKIVKIKLIFKIPDPNIPVRLFRLNGSNYIVYGFGGVWTGNGNDISIRRIDETAPPLIKMLSKDAEVMIGSTLTINGLAVFSPDMISYTDVALYKNNDVLVNDFGTVVSASPTLTHSFVVESDDVDVSYAFKGTVSGGDMDGTQVASDQIFISSFVDGLNKGHIGAFYFGGEFENSVIDTYTIPTIFVSPIGFVEDSLLQNVPVPTITLSVPSETSNIKLYDPWEFDFSASPRSGRSPFETTFKVFNYEPIDNYVDVWEAYEFHWWFGDSGDIIVTSSDTISHVYCGSGGVSGTAFDVSACVKYRLKN